MTESEAMTEIEAIEVIEKNRPTSGYEMLNEALDMAIKLLEKQIPKKPIEMKPTDKLLNGYFACPICGGWVGMDEYSNKYCGCCGNKIDWSE